MGEGREIIEKQNPLNQPEETETEKDSEWVIAKNERDDPNAQSIPRSQNKTKDFKNLPEDEIDQGFRFRT